MRRGRSTGSGRILPALAVVLALVALPTAPIAAQEVPEPLTDEELTAFAEVFLDVQEVREVFQTEMGGTHDAVGQARLRAEFEESLTEILERHETTRAEFDRITAIVSLDDEHRARFEAILVELQERGGGA